MSCNPPLTYYALVDANNFYASCERVFDLSIRNKPVVVLSNNDGCVIARSNEAKALNIEMGEPYFKIKALVKKHQVKVFSSNYVLYGDMSARIVNILRAQCAHVEVYSIDESFLKLDFHHTTPHKLEAYATQLRATVLRNTGIPVSVGIATTKTLAKLANHIAKKHTTTGVYFLTPTAPILENINVKRLWGVGRAYLRRLNAIGIETVLQFSKLSPYWMRKEFGVVGVRLLKEVQGFACYRLEDEITERKNTMVSRSFKTDIYQLDVLKEKTATFATRLGEKLRQYQQSAKVLTVYLWVNKYNNKRTDGQRCFSATIELPLATSNTNELIAYTNAVVKGLYQPNTNYKKAGVLASDLRPQQVLQTNLFHSEKQHLRNQQLMKAIDDINRKNGRNTVHFAALGTQTQHMRPNAAFKSPRYTTNWNELLKVK